ncbi:hypothetical protein F4803DRAFT_520951 [Xylaria telfairii]|nr:hypothetical protein F4803DRAFT_520951 [Xylaria telfairii]
MEAIAAAGALPGLASATVQLGTATFQFYQQLHSLYKAIKHGENDLNTAIKRLDQHGDFIKELRFHFERIASLGVECSTRDLFERYVADSEAEVEEFRNLLNRVGKQHFKKKSWQAVETGSRLRFHERSIQKYCDLLDKQMQRFLFLQSSVQSMCLESTLSEVKETLVKQGARAIAFYDEQSSKEISGKLRPRLGGRSDETQQFLRGTRKDNLSLQHDITSDDWHVHQMRRYPTLCGTLKVSKFLHVGTSNAKDYQFAYTVRFEPHSWISRTLVNWRCLIDSTHRIPTLMLSVTTGIICEDRDVIDALGLVTCDGRFSSRWCRRLCHPKVPNLGKVKALLNTGRLLKEHVVSLQRPFWVQTDVLTVCFECLGHYDTEPRTYGNICCSSSGSAELLRYYREFYDVMELLFSRGFKPTLSSWESIYYQAVKYQWRISQQHPKLIRASNLTSKSILHLILKRCGYSIPVNILTTFEEQLHIHSSQLPHGHTWRLEYEYMLSYSLTISSHLGYLIALELPAEIIRREIPDLDLLDLVDEQHILDRWLLGLFAPYRPEIASLLHQYLKSYKTTAAHKQFEIEYICEEIQWPSNTMQRKELLSFICFHGNATILQQLDITALAQRDLEDILYCSSQSSDQEIFDIMSIRTQSPRFDIMSIYTKSQWIDKLPHTKIVRERLASDPVFLSNFIASLERRRNSELLSEIFQDNFIVFALSEADSNPLPTYMRNFIVGLVQKHGNNPTAIGSAIHSMIYSSMVHHCQWNRSAEVLLQNLNLYSILGLIAHSSTFKSALSISGLKNKYDPVLAPAQHQVCPYPSVDGYSALMIALHCGMRPAVQVLVDAGASISTPISRGKSALSLAYENTRAQHPRPWLGKYDPTSPVISGLSGTQRRFLVPGKYDALWVSESTDREMLQILLKALHDRCEVVEEELNRLPTWSKRVIFKKARYFTQWLFKPSYTFDTDTFRENSIYVILVSVLWFLSVLKVLKVELGDYPFHVGSLLSRPIVALAVVGLILSILL